VLSAARLPDWPLDVAWLNESTLLVAFLGFSDGCFLEVAGWFILSKKLWKAAKLKKIKEKNRYTQTLHLRMFIQGSS